VTVGARIRLFGARLRAFLTGGRLDRDFAQELESHLEMLTDDHIRRGLSPEEARRQAALRLGGAASLQARHRDARGFRALDDLAQDLRFAARLIVKERWVSAAAVAAIALGIGANTVGFTIINAAYFRGFAFERADELHSISWVPTRGRRLPSSVPDLEDWRSEARSFTAVAASTAGALNISDDHAAPEQTRGASITANLFDVLRQRPLLGRTFVAGEDQRGAEPVVIIGHDLWRTRFNLDPAVVGRTLRVNGRGATIIGVMPDGMKFPDDSELWVPFIPEAEHQARDRRLLSVFGRLAPGVSREQAHAEVDGIARRILAAQPELTRSAVGGQVETLNERFLNGSAPRMFLTIMGAVTFVLLIACANVATLLLSRVIYRSREIAVRYAVGATRWRVLRQLLIESVTLAGLGGVAGLALATAGVGAFDAAIRASGAPYWLRFTIDYRVLAYVAATCVGAGVLFGLVPALQVSRQSPHDTLKDGVPGRGRDAAVGAVEPGAGGGRTGAHGGAAVRRRADAAQLHGALHHGAGLRGGRPHPDAPAVAAHELPDGRDAPALLRPTAAARGRHTRRRAGRVHHGRAAPRPRGMAHRTRGRALRAGGAAALDLDGARHARLSGRARRGPDARPRADVGRPGARRHPRAGERGVRRAVLPRGGPDRPASSVRGPR
jgi:hypothetical protein